MRVLKKKAVPGCPSFDYMKAANGNEEISYIDVKYLFDLMWTYKARIRRLISLFRAWEKNYQEQRDVRVLMFFRLEGSLIYRQIINELCVYDEVRKQARFLQSAYYQNIKNRKTAGR